MHVLSIGCEILLLILIKLEHILSTISCLFSVKFNFFFLKCKSFSFPCKGFLLSHLEIAQPSKSCFVIRAAHMDWIRNPMPTTHTCMCTRNPSFSDGTSGRRWAHRVVCIQSHETMWWYIYLFILKFFWIQPETTGDNWVGAMLVLLAQIVVKNCLYLLLCSEPIEQSIEPCNSCN